MASFDYIFEMMENNADITTIRRNISNEIRKGLELKKDSFGYWQKMHFACAINALYWNEMSYGDIWLRLSLVMLEGALLPTGEYNENHVPHDKSIEVFTYDILMGYLSKIKENRL